MPDREHRMTQQHSGTGKPHDLFYALPHFRLITMDRALITNRLIRSEWTFLYAFIGIRQQLCTVRTKRLLRAMLFSAIEPDHNFDGLKFHIHDRFHLVL